MEALALTMSLKDFLQGVLCAFFSAWRMLATLVQGVDESKSSAFVDICLDALKDPKLEVRQIM